VVEVEMAVGGAGHVRERDPVLAQGVLDRRHAWRERRLDLLVAEPRTVVEQEDAVAMDHRMRVGRPPFPGEQLLLVGR
jgi:hypothetical protein